MILAAPCEVTSIVASLSLRLSESICARVREMSHQVHLKPGREKKWSWTATTTVASAVSCSHLITVTFGHFSFSLTLLHLFLYAINDRALWNVFLFFSDALRYRFSTLHQDVYKWASLLPLTLSLFLPHYLPVASCSLSMILNRTQRNHRHPQLCGDQRELMERQEIHETKTLPRAPCS